MLQKTVRHTDTRIFNYNLVFTVLLKVKLPCFQADEISGIALLKAAMQASLAGLVSCSSLNL